MPDLLSVVRQFIQKKEFKFAMTGSSAQETKAGEANLLGGGRLGLSFQAWPLKRR